MIRPIKMLKTQGSGAASDLPLGHNHKWSNIKRWMEEGELQVLQRCRRCDTWQRTSIPVTLKKNSLTRKTIVESEKSQPEVKDVSSETGDLGS